MTDGMTQSSSPVGAPGGWREVVVPAVIAGKDEMNAPSCHQKKEKLFFLAPCCCLLYT